MWVDCHWDEYDALVDHLFDDIFVFHNTVEDTNSSKENTPPHCLRIVVVLDMEL